MTAAKSNLTKSTKTKPAQKSRLKNFYLAEPTISHLGCSAAAHESTRVFLLAD
jgi:hypothetical protein